MFTTAFTEIEACNWSACPHSTNAVEHINKDSVPAKEYKRSIWNVLDNIYQCDKLAGAKRLAVLSNVTISYPTRPEDSRQERAARKRKWRRSFGKLGDDYNAEGRVEINSVNLV